MKIPANLLTERAIPTRYSLLSRLQNREDQESWKEFFDTYWRLIYAFAIKSGLTEAEAQDAVQETVICVARDIHKFKRDRALGSFKGWLQNIIRWRVADQFRKRKSGRHDGETPGAAGISSAVLDEVAEADGGGQESLWDQEWQANLIAAALDRVKRRVQEEQFQIFDLYAVKGWPVVKVARAMKVSAAKVYLVKHRILALVKQEVRALEKKAGL